jgi:hypothetical protein
VSNDSKDIEANVEERMPQDSLLDSGLLKSKETSISAIVESRYYYATNVMFTERGRVYVITQVR